MNYLDALADARDELDEKYGVGAKPTPPRETMSREARLAYLAGIIDGEGSVLWSRSRDMIAVQVSNTDRSLMRWLQLHWQGSVSKSPSKNPKHKLCWKWCLSGNRAADLLQEAFPYLLIKRRRAETALSLWWATGPRQTRYEELY